MAPWKVRWLRRSRINDVTAQSSTIFLLETVVFYPLVDTELVLKILIHFSTHNMELGRVWVNYFFSTILYHNIIAS